MCISIYCRKDIIIFSVVQLKMIFFDCFRYKKFWFIKKRRHEARFNQRAPCLGLLWLSIINEKLLNSNYVGFLCRFHVPGFQSPVPDCCRQVAAGVSGTGNR